MPREADHYELTPAEKRDLIRLIEQGRPLPDKYRFILFEDKREVELVWNGKTREVCTAILPFQTLEHIDEPRKETGSARASRAVSGALAGNLESSGAAAAQNSDAAREEDESSARARTTAREARALPIQPDLLDLSGRQIKGWTNKLIWGDNKLILSSLKAGALRRQIEDAGGLKLIYIDPPFDVGADFSMDIEIGGETFHKEPNLLEQIAYRDTWGRGADSFIAMIYERLILMRYLMHREGMLFLHMGWNISHHVRLVADEVFGRENFINQIIWRRQTAHSDIGQGSEHLGRIHDVVLLYSKSEHFTWNMQYQPYSKEYEEAFYKEVEPETGRRFQLGDITAPGGASKGNPYYEFLGVTRFWRFSEKRMKELYAAGKIVQKKPGTVPRQKRYLDEMPGVPLQDLWLDINTVQPQSFERTGYATQKPEELLERIIKLSSNEGDLVADFFCGSGTTAAVAEKLGRKWIATDLGKFGIHTTRKRLIQVQRELKAAGRPFRAFEVLNLGRYERQAYLNVSGRLSAKKKAEALARKEQEFRDLILRAYRAEPLGGGSFGPGSAPAPGAVSRGLAGNLDPSGEAALQKNDAARDENESSARARMTAREARALPSDSFFHGKAGNRLVVVGPINLPVGRLFIEEVITETRKRGASRVDVLAFEFEMGLFPAVLDEAKRKGIDLAPKTIPPEVFDKRAVEKGQVRFHDVAYIEVTPRFGSGSAPAPGAVSRALAGNPEACEPSNASGQSSATEQSARARTAAAGAAALPGGKDSLTLAVELTDFSVYYSQGISEAITAELKNGKSEVVCDAGKLIKISKDKHGVVTREVLTKQWTDWVDYWAVDFDYESRKEIIKVPKRLGVEGELPGTVQADSGEFVDFEERWTGAYIFENQWQSFRTRQNRELELISAPHTYERPGRYVIAVKVIDIFGNDTMTLVPVTVG